MRFLDNHQKFNPKTNNLFPRASHAAVSTPFVVSERSRPFHASCLPVAFPSLTVALVMRICINHFFVCDSMKTTTFTSFLVLALFASVSADWTQELRLTLANYALSKAANPPSGPS